MNKKRGFTLIELLVVISVIAILLAILMPALNKAREFGKRIICLTNLKNLTMGWMMYANENNGKLCSGQLAIPEVTIPIWCGDAQSKYPEAQQKTAIRNGAIYPYVKNVNTYRCPTAVKGEFESYAVVDGMCGRGMDLIQTGVSPKGLIYTNMNDIKRASARLVFLDEGYISMDSYAIRYKRNWWWDRPAIRHGKGDTWSFADCHAEFNKWAGRLTLENGKAREFGVNQGGGSELTEAQSKPRTADDLRDLVYVQMGCYGKLGWDPSTMGF